MEWGVGVGRVAGDSGMGIKEEERFCRHDTEKGRISCMQPLSPEHTGGPGLQPWRAL